MYTSGTTGRPKGAEPTHIQLHMNADIPGRLFDVQPDVVITALPLFHVFGLSSIVNVCVRFGDLKKSPLVMLAAVQPVLTEAGLVRVSNAGWTVLPVAGRYRDPKAVWEPTLEDMTHDDA